MKIVRTIAELAPLRSGTVGLVPTMGAFHEGHLSLMQAARSVSDTLVVSLFVNPTQFGPNEDYARYPRDEARDAEMAESVGVDVLFAPCVEEMYPRKTTVVSVKGVTDLWEGAQRPGHFDGVATVVCKLFSIVRPNMAFFGLKDFQQCAVIRRMVEDLNLPVALRFCDTLREPSGLAMSSRNQYLSAEQREIAPALYRELCCTSADLRSGSCEIGARLGAAKARLAQAGFLVDYLALVDCRTLEPIGGLDAEARLIAAAKLGPVRLIDNVAV